MKRTDRNPAIGRAAAAAALAVLLAACGKDVRVSGGGGGPVDETRLAVGTETETVREGLPRWTQRLAIWTPSEVERNSLHAAYTDLLSIFERAAIPAAGMSAAAGLRPAVAQDSVSYPRARPDDNAFSGSATDSNAFWQESATDSARIAYWANSGVSQSSRGAPSGKVGDRVHAEVGWSGSDPTFRVGLRHYADGSLADWILDSESPDRSGGYFTRWTAPDSATHGGRGGAFRSGVPGGGTVTLVVRTDRTGAEDTDWLATGMWWTQTLTGMLRPQTGPGFGPTSASPESFGVFADGGDPIFAGVGGGDPVAERERLRRLTGKATYTGYSHGVFSYAAAGANANRNIPFQGSAALTADFSDASTLGSVTGRIQDMKWGGGPLIPGTPRIAFSGQLSPGLQRRGMFKGGARMTYAGENYNGRWGGQFFGSSSVAGTFGVAADAGHSFVGAFEAHASGLSSPIATLRLSEWARERALRAPTAAERAGPHAAYTDLATVAERAAIPAAGVSSAAGLRPSFAQITAGYTRQPPYSHVAPDNGAFWQESAPASGPLRERVAYWASAGVSQSSREGASGRVGDKVHAEIGWSGSAPTYRVELRYAGDPLNPGPLTHWTLDSESPGQTASYLARWTEPGGAARGAAFRSGVPGGGNMTLLVRTDRTGAADTDWLATGMWWSSTTNAPRESFGVFADGGDVLNSHNLARFHLLAGTATYAGAAHGVFSHTAGGENSVFFRGTATLDADFGDTVAYGSVSGRIDDMKAGGPMPGSPAITLGAARVDGSLASKARFQGGASMTYAGENYSGRWGGQFFGNAGANAHPSSAAGTFGVAAGEDSSFVGAFEVRR